MFSWSLFPETHTGQLIKVQEGSRDFCTAVLIILGLLYLRLGLLCLWLSSINYTGLVVGSLWLIDCLDTRLAIWHLCIHYERRKTKQCNQCKKVCIQFTHCCSWAILSSWPVWDFAPSLPFSLSALWQRGSALQTFICTLGRHCQLGGLDTVYTCFVYCKSSSTAISRLLSMIITVDQCPGYRFTWNDEQDFRFWHHCIVLCRSRAQNWANMLCHALYLTLLQDL